MSKQIAKNVIEGLKDQAKHTGKAVVREPLNIVKEMMGESGSDERGQASTSSSQQNLPMDPRQQRLVMLKKQEEIERQRKLAIWRKRKAQVDREAQLSKMEEDEEERERLRQQREEKLEKEEKVVQLRQEEEKESVLQRKIKGKVGTKEMGPRKRF